MRRRQSQPSEVGSSRWRWQHGEKGRAPGLLMSTRGGAPQRQGGVLCLSPKKVSNVAASCHKQETKESCRRQLCGQLPRQFCRKVGRSVASQRPSVPARVGQSHLPASWRRVKRSQGDSGDATIAARGIQVVRYGFGRRLRGPRALRLMASSASRVLPMEEARQSTGLEPQATSQLIGRDLIWSGLVGSGGKVFARSLDDARRLEEQGEEEKACATGCNHQPIQDEELSRHSAVQGRVASVPAERVSWQQEGKDREVTCVVLKKARLGRVLLCQA